jgi:hypothetical protein
MEMKKMLKPIAVFTVFGVLAGCSSHVIKEDPRSYVKQDIALTEMPPSKDQLAGKPPRIVVFAAELSGDRLAANAGLDVLVSTAIENSVRKTGVKVVDRSIAKRFSKELALAESKGRATYEGEDVADFAILPKVTNSNFSSEYHKAYYTEDKEGKRVYHEARCEFTATTKGYMDIYEMPALKSVARVEFGGRDIDYQDAKGRYWYGGECKYSKANVKSLVTLSAERALMSKAREIKAHFPPTGYVVELRSNKDGQLILKTTLGSSKGGSEKAKIKILKKRLEQNDLTGEADIASIVIGEGVISNRIQEKYSWVVLDAKKSQLGEIAVGDRVEVDFSVSSFLDMIESVQSGLMN